MQLRNFLAVHFSLVLLVGCAGPSIAPQDRELLEGPARALEARGEWREAAAVWEQSAQTLDGSIGAEFRLNGADALLQAGDGAGAEQIARALPPDIPARLDVRRTLILADAAIQAGNAADALQRVGPGLTSADAGIVARYRRIRADALEMSGDAMGASRERALRDSLLAGSEERYRNRQRIWDLLARVPVAQLEAPLPQVASPHDGWVELAAIVRRNALDAARLDAAVRDWSNRFPGHPAGEEIVPEVIELARTEAQAPRKVALLLPQTGPFAAVAAAIREGFMAAWYADAPNPQRPQIMLVDTHAQDAALAYARAVNDGAQFVVGPLAKESVGAVIDGAALSVTTLALNYPVASAARVQPDASEQHLVVPADAATADADTPPIGNRQRAYYFVLSPEDEARRAAEYAHEHGARQAAVLSATGPWGERVGQAFAQRWRELGGAVVATASFPEEAQGLSAAVEQLLNIDRSEARARQLRAVLVRNIKHEPRPRSDVDVIFMAAFPQAARQLRPLLQFHRAADVPVLATSHVYTGVADPQADQDLNDVIFADMPWLLTPDAHSLPAQARGLWPDSDGALGRLYAFGADAYALIGRLRGLRMLGRSSFAGLTGELSLDKQQRIRRDMLWSRFVAGVAQPIDSESLSSIWSGVGR